MFKLFHSIMYFCNKHIEKSFCIQQKRSYQSVSASLLCESVKFTIVCRLVVLVLVLIQSWNVLDCKPSKPIAMQLHCLPFLNPMVITLAQADGRQLYLNQGSPICNGMVEQQNITRIWASFPVDASIHQYSNVWVSIKLFCIKIVVFLSYKFMNHFFKCINRQPKFTIFYYEKKPTWTSCFM